MSILVVSDSHGLQNELIKIANRHRDEVTTFIHCGDSELSADSDVLNDFQVVKGNCDIFAKFPKQLIVDADGLKIFVTHGHLYNVKATLDELIKQAASEGCNITCFGHTHDALLTQMNGITALNPGSIKKPRGRDEKTYAIILNQGDKVEINFYNLDGEKVTI